MTPLLTAAGLGLLLAASPAAEGNAEGAQPAHRIVSKSIETRDGREGGTAWAIRESGAQGTAAWVGWTAPVIEGRRRMCCFDSINRVHDPQCCFQCRLEDKQSSGSFSIDDDRRDLEPSGNFVVVARVSGKGG